MSNPKLLPIQSDRSLQLPLPTLVTLFDPELPILFFLMLCVCVCVCKHQLYAAGKKICRLPLFCLSAHCRNCKYWILTEAKRTFWPCILPEILCSIKLKEKCILLRFFLSYQELSRHTWWDAYYLVCIFKHAFQKTCNEKIVLYVSNLEKFTGDIC